MDGTFTFGQMRMMNQFIFISQRAGLPRMPTKIWILRNNSFKLANNDSQVPPKVLRHILAVMQASVEEYKTLWLQYQKEIRYIDC